MRPLHLRQLISTEAIEPGRRLLNSLTTLTNMALDGRIPESARDAFFGVPSVFCKRSMEMYDRSLQAVTPHSAHHLADLNAPDLRPVQLGVGTRLGREAAVHATREFITGLAADSPPSVLVKDDVRNAFNSVRRDVMLRAILDSGHEIYRLAFQAYSAPIPFHRRVYYHFSLRRTAGLPSWPCDFLSGHRRPRTVHEITFKSVVPGWRDHSWTYQLSDTGHSVGTQAYEQCCLNWVLS